MAGIVFRVTYQDSMLTHLTGSLSIVVDHGGINGAAQKLQKEYGQHQIDESLDEPRYLVNGVYIEANKKGSDLPADMTSEVILRGESITGLEMVANSLGLPLPTEFIAYQKPIARPFANLPSIADRRRDRCD